MSKVGGLESTKAALLLPLLSLFARRCESIVVALDPFCCDVSWDGICAGEATQYCLPVGATCVDKKEGECPLALPPYSSTYSATLTRGYFFQAPLSFEISGLSVPKEQNSELFRTFK